MFWGFFHLTLLCGWELAQSQSPRLTAIAPLAPLRAARRATDIGVREALANQYPADVHPTDQQRSA
jgi:hypothetical protein